MCFTAAVPEPSPEVVRIRFYPKYTDAPGPHKPQIYEMKKSSGSTQPIHVKRLSAEGTEAQAGSVKDEGNKISGQTIGAMTVPGAKNESPVISPSLPCDDSSQDQVFVFGSNKKREFHADLPVVEKYKFNSKVEARSATALKVDTKRDHKIHVPVQTSIPAPKMMLVSKIPKETSEVPDIVPQPDDKLQLLKKGAIPPPRSSSIPANRNPPSTKIGLQRTSYLKPPANKPNQPQMGKLTIKCGSESNVNSGSEERQGKSQAVPKGVVPPLAEMDSVDALDLSSSVTPSSPDLQVSDKPSSVLYQYIVCMFTY